VAAAAVIPNSQQVEKDPANKVSSNAQVNLKKQLDFIKSFSNPDVKDQVPVDPREPIEIAIKAISNQLKGGKIFSATQSEEEKVPEKPPPTKFPGLNLSEKYGQQMNADATKIPF
jgi:hypothetical protein